jgi:hypothetical protein
MKDPKNEIGNVCQEIAIEVTRAVTLFGPQASPHESLGIIMEEFDEFRQEVYRFNVAKGRDTRPAMRTELIQLAAMAVRAIHDLNLGGENERP